MASSTRTALVVLCALALGVTLMPATSGAQEPGDGGVTAARVRGEHRFETAARIAALTFEQADVAVLVTGQDFPDALAGSYAAGLLAGPILLTEGDSVPPATLGALGDLGVDTVVILGGTAVVGEQVEQLLADEGYATQRIAGETRYHTAAEVARRYGGPDSPTQLLEGDRTALLASGERFPDALAAGPLAAKAHLPLLLTRHGRTVPIVGETLAELGIERLLVIGGDAAVSDAVVAAYRNQGYAVERLAGSTRGDTATVVADHAIGRFAGFSEQLMLLARGDDFPDALTASVYGAHAGAPITLSATPHTLGGATAGWLAARCPGVDVVRALGGTGAVSGATLDAAVAAAQRCLRPDQEVSRFSTPLLGIPDRTHNLHLAADYIDGDVIPAGATYSLNRDGTGPRTRARGFREVEGGCIGAGGAAVDCVGGGVSQMGTTFMNAAWFAGIALEEFRQHSLYFQRYPVCHEATLSYGTLDVVVRNNSPYDILIDAFYDDTIVGVRFLSRPWASVDSWEQPENPPSSGSFTSQCGRTITYPDGTSTTESYTWTYEGTGF